MKALLKYLLSFFITIQVFGQTNYIKKITDSTNNYLFGKVVFIDVDSLYIHTIINSNSPQIPFLSPYNSFFYLKIDKASGHVISSKVFNPPMNLRATAALKYKNSIYIATEITLQGQVKVANVIKYNYQSGNLIWQRSLLHTPNTGFTANTIEYSITDIRLNQQRNKLILFGQGVKSHMQMLPVNGNGGIGCNVGYIDTNNVNYAITNFMWMNAVQTHYVKNAKLVILKNSTKARGILCDSTSGKIRLINYFNYNQLYLSNFVWLGFPTDTVKELNIFGNGIQFVDQIGSRIIYFVDQNNSSTCFITDSVNNFISVKQFNGLHARSLSVNNGSAALTFVNDLGNGRACELLSINVDSNLTVLSSKKMDIDTFRLRDFTCNTYWEANNFYTIFNKKKFNSTSAFIYKNSISNLICNEQSFVTQAIQMPITFTNTALTYSGGPHPVSYTISLTNKLLKDTITCFNNITPYPLANFISMPACQGSVFTITNTSSNNPTSFMWSFQSANILTTTAQNPAVQYLSNGVYNATLTATNNFGSNTIVKTITINPLPNIQVNSGGICLGNNFTISPSGAITYTILGSASIVSPSIASNYSIVGTDINGCISGSPAICNVSIMPSPTLMISTSKTLMCLDDQGTLTVNGAATYTWNNNNIGNTLVIIPTWNATFSASGTGANGCISSTSFTQKTSYCTDINKVNFNEFNLKIFPNPSSYFIKINFDKSILGEIAEIIINNTIGQNIFKLQTKIINNETSIPVDEWPEGSYFIRIKIKENINYRTFLIKK